VLAGSGWSWSKLTPARAATSVNDMAKSA